MQRSLSRSSSSPIPAIFRSEILGFSYSSAVRSPPTPIKRRSMDELHLVVLPPDDRPIGNVHADANQNHPPVITYSQELTANFYNVKMEHIMESTLSYEAVMAELHRLIEHQFRAYYNAERARYGNHPPCSPPPPAAN